MYCKVRNDFIQQMPSPCQRIGRIIIYVHRLLHVSKLTLSLTELNHINPWQGEGICCMKSLRTLQYTIYMNKMNGLHSRFRWDRSKVTNKNSNIYSSYKCGTKFCKFFFPNANTENAPITEISLSIMKLEPKRSQFKSHQKQGLPRRSDPQPDGTEPHQSLATVMYAIS